MRFALGMLFLGTLAIVGSACASRYRWPVAVSGVRLKQPHAFKLRNGSVVPCGTGIAWVFGADLCTCAVDRRVAIQGHDFPAGAELYFLPDGTLEWARWVEPRPTLVHPSDACDTRVVSFDQSGRIVSSELECRRETTSKPAATDRSR